MPCYPPSKVGTARELQQLGKDGWNTRSKRILASSVAETFVPLSTAPGTSVTPKTPQDSVHLQGSKENGFTSLSQVGKVRDLERPG